MYRFWAFLATKKSFSLLVITALVLTGIYSVFVIPKESSPEVQIPIAVISTPFPGASTEDVETLVTKKIEDRLSSTLSDIDEITSSSSEGVSVVVVQFNAQADIDRSITEVKDEIDTVIPELPSSAEDPIVSEVDLVDQPVIVISVSSDLPVTEFIELSNYIESELEAISGVSRIEKSGLPERETQVIVSRDALRQFNVRLVDVVGAIAGSNSSLPIGSIETSGVSYAVRFEGNITDPAELNDIAILNIAGEPIYIRDIAFVSNGVSDQTTTSRISIEGEPAQQALTLSIYKKSGGDITRVTSAVRDRLEKLENEITADIEMLISYDLGDFVRTDLISLSTTGLQTILLVFAILLISIGWREAVVAGLAIPLSFLIAFVGLYYSGNTINFISLFSLILAIGILVDSAIVITEGMHTKLEHVESPTKAALYTIKEFHKPLISGTMTTIAVFAPLFLISGITGEFIASIPFTIIFILLASLFVALGVVPLISTFVLKQKNGNKLSKIRSKYTERLKIWYVKSLNKIIGDRKRENRFMQILVVLFVISAALPIVGIVKTAFFPQDDSDFLYAELRMPKGTILEETDLTTRRLESLLYEEPNITSFATTIGSGSAFGGGGSGEEIANITILLDEEREETSTEILERLRENAKTISRADIYLSQPASGPPVGAPVLIRFLGDDLNELSMVADEAKTILEEIPGAIDVETSLEEGAIDFVFTIDRSKASSVGLDVGTIASTLRTAIHGTKATTIKSSTNDIDVIVKLAVNADYQTPHDTNRVTPDAIRTIEIATPKGPVLLGSVIDVSIKKTPVAIEHQDGTRVAEVSANVADGYYASDVLGAFMERSDAISLPENITMSIGGENEEVNQSFKDMGAALFVGILLILAILVLQFNSFRYAFFIIVIVPVSLIGIMFGLMITRQPLSFTSVMGYIALSGIVVNNSIILIDKINSLRQEKPGRDIANVVVEGSASRLRPILLTTFTTVIGIVPLTYASATWAPLAFAIIFGLSFAVLVTLVLVPIIYVRWSGPLQNHYGNLLKPNSEKKRI
jgi:multidrug efflux pump subunit AcrB